MKEVEAAIVAVVGFLLIGYLNRKIIGDRSVWKGRWIQPRGTYRNGFPIVPTNVSEVERRNPSRRLWALVDLFILTVLAIVWLEWIR